MHLDKKLPLSALKAHTPFPISTGVQSAYGFPASEVMWTNTELGYAAALQQPLHLERYFPVSALNATLSPTT